MNSKLKNEILINLKSNDLFAESIPFFKSTQIDIIKKIITDKLVGNKLIYIINKLDGKITIDMLSEDDLLFLNDFYNNTKYIKILEILLKLKAKYKDIDNYVKIINIIYNIIAFSITFIFVYLIIDMYLINKDKTDIDFYLYYGIDIVSNILLFLTVISFSEVIILLLSNIITILNYVPFSVWLGLTKFVLIKLLLNYKFLFEKMGDIQGRITLVIIIIFILLLNFYNIYLKVYANENYVTFTNFMAFIGNRYVKPNMDYIELIYKTFDKYLDVI